MKLASRFLLSRLAVLVGMLTLFIVAPNVAYAQDPIPEGISKTELFGTVLRRSRWPDNAFPIPVCWENPHGVDRRYRQLTQTAVEKTWEANSKVRFKGWDACKNEQNKGIRILIAEVGPHVNALGRYLDGRQDGMVLNFTFGTWSPSCRKSPDRCVYAIAVHEFGHALGYTHEQNRSDAPPECQKERQGTDGDYLVTKYDGTSIMNYCNKSIYKEGGAVLSKLDVEALNEVYKTLR